MIRYWDLLRLWLKSRRRKPILKLKLKGIEMNYRFLVTMPEVPSPSVDPGIASWILTPVHDGVEQPSLTGAVDVLSTEILVPALPGGGSPVVDLLLAYVDKAGNVGSTSKFTFSQPDNIAPAAPGEVSVSLLGTDEDTVPVDPSINPVA